MNTATSVDQFYADYLVFTDTVARYPKEIEKLYLALGLCDETCDEFTRSLEHGHAFDMFLELGDAQWYAARLCQAFGYSFPALIQAAKMKRGTVGEGTLASVVTDLSMTAGAIAGRVKKEARDGHMWNAETRANFETVLRGMFVDFFVFSFVVIDRLWSRNAKIGNYDACLSENIKKLGGRLERGTLQGDGDHR